jgi:hypothetical protein
LLINYNILRISNVPLETPTVQNFGSPISIGVGAPNFHSGMDLLLDVWCGFSTKTGLSVLVAILT